MCEYADVNGLPMTGRLYVVLVVEIVNPTKM